MVTIGTFSFMSELPAPTPVRRLWLAVLCGYLALGATIQEIPGFVVHHFHGGAVLSGTAVGIAFLATACTRPFAGLTADQGRARYVVALGGVLGALGGLGHLWAPNVPVLLVSRLLMGAGEGALFSGALPWVLTGSPAARRGRVAGWFGLSMWGGLSAGPVLASAVDYARGSTGVWQTVFVLSVLSSVLVLSTRGQPKPGTPLSLPRTPRELVPSGAPLPGLVFGLAAYGYGTVAGLLVLYLSQSGIGGEKLALPLFAAGFLLTRTFGSPVVDRLGGAPVAAVSLGVEIIGLLLIAVSGSEIAALAGATLAGVGVSLMYPATVSVTLARTGALRPGTAVGVMTSFWDLGIMVAGPLGGLIALAAYPAAFSVAAVTALVALVVAAGPLRAPTQSRTPAPELVS